MDHVFVHQFHSLSSPDGEELCGCMPRQVGIRSKIMIDLAELVDVKVLVSVTI
jgi:hypothetical protein